jgi:hypothetical protein
VAIAAPYYVRALVRLDHMASDNSALSFADRDIAGGNSIVVDQEAAYEARALIPPRAAYRVAVGPSIRGATSLTASFVTGWFLSFLMPRRQASGARWIICYGCDRSTLGASFELRWEDDSGISIGALR